MRSNSTIRQKLFLVDDTNNFIPPISCGTTHGLCLLQSVLDNLLSKISYGYRCRRMFITNVFQGELIIKLYVTLINVKVESLSKLHLLAFGGFSLQLTNLSSENISDRTEI